MANSIYNFSGGLRERVLIASGLTVVLKFKICAVNMVNGRGYPIMSLVLCRLDKVGH